MTPKEKAKELCKKYLELSKNQYHQLKYLDHSNFPKLAAHIAVDEIIEATSIKYEFRDAELFYAGKKPMQYWLDVKKEIQKL